MAWEHVDVLFEGCLFGDGVPRIPRITRMADKGYRRLPKLRPQFEELARLICFTL